MDIKTTDIIVIGAGPIGLFSVFEAGMLGMKCHVFDSLEFIGGQCSALYPEKPIYDIAGFPSIKAQDLIDKLEKQAAPFNPQYHLQEQIVSVEKNGDDFIVKSGDRIAQLIIAKHESIIWNNVESIDTSLRGEGGFGSTGLN